MKIPLSKRVQRIKPSPTLSISARAAELRAEGKDVLGLSVGEPDFDTPEWIKKEAYDAIKSGFTKYTAVDGIPELKTAIIEKFKRDNQLTYAAQHILVSSGAKHSLYNLMQALINAGDEVIIPAPYWVSYPAMVLLAEGQPIIPVAPIEQHFKLTAQQLNEHITPNTKLLVLNSPSNPTGVLYSAEELKALSEVLLKHPHVFIVTDDIYEHIVWKKGSFVNVLNVCPELYERTIIVNGVSKAFAMTGWRIGYAAGPAELIGAMKKIQSQSTSNPTSIAQKAAVAALNGDHQAIDTMVAAFKTRHDVLLQGLQGISGFKCVPACGTFYLFPNVTEAMARLGIENDINFAEYLLDKAGVAVVPGSAFGLPGHIRLSYATRSETLDKALERIRAVV